MDPIKEPGVSVGMSSSSAKLKRNLYTLEIKLRDYVGINGENYMHSFCLNYVFNPVPDVLYPLQFVQINVDATLMCLLSKGNCTFDQTSACNFSGMCASI